MHKPARAPTPQAGGKQLVDRGKRVLALEAAAVQRVADTLGPAFARAVEILAGAKGRVIISGVGKSGPQDRRDVHVHRDAGDVPPSRGLAARRSRHRESR